MPDGQVVGQASTRRTPPAIAVISMTRPISSVQLAGAGETRPVKKIRIRCMTIAARNTRAAQWWVCRISSPNGVVSARDRRVERYAGTSRPRAAVRTFPRTPPDGGAGVEPERQVDAGRDQHDEGSTGRSRPTGTTSGRGTRSASLEPHRMRSSRASPTTALQAPRTITIPADAPSRRADRPGHCPRLPHARRQPSSLAAAEAAARPAGPNSTQPRVRSGRTSSSGTGRPAPGRGTCRARERPERKIATAQPACVQILEYATSPCDDHLRSVVDVAGREPQQAQTGDPSSRGSAPSGKACR